MIDSRLSHCNQLKTFLGGTKEILFSSSSKNKEEKYDWIKDVLTRFDFRHLSKKERGMIREYIQKISGYSDSQLTRLIKRYLRGRLFINKYQKYVFPVKYSPHDIALLCQTDNAHSRLNAYATKEILIREHMIFKKQEYQTIKNISPAHIYNLRKTRFYVSHSLTFKKTIATQVRIGERRKPQPEGRPGYLRVDTVHQGDRDGEKGVYHINTVDEVLQWEVVGCVEQISEAYLEPLLVVILDQYPFIIFEFHPDNGSEYINRVVIKLLNRLLIRLSKSRSRHCNDNALVEGKNGSVIRKHMGYFYINQKYAPEINDFYQRYFNPYLNFHRPCGFATTKIDEKGKQKKVYTHYLTPYEALKRIVGGHKFLKGNISFEKLDKIAYQYSDNEFAEIMEEEKQKLFKKIKVNPIDF
jgi:transposase InsO family protein